MAYVDLNPIRAGISKLLETSESTSIQERIDDYQTSRQKPRLVPLIGNDRQENVEQDIHFNLQDYLELVDWTSRAIREDKPGVILTMLNQSCTDSTSIPTNGRKASNITAIDFLDNLTASKLWPKMLD